MKFELFTRIALATDIPEYRLKKGDIATIVDYLVTEDVFHASAYRAGR